MLSAFTARPLVELKQRDKSKIESILAFGDRLLVGLHTGSLRIYRVNETVDPPSSTGQLDGTETGEQQQQQQQDEAPAAPPAHPVDLLRELEKFSTRSIQQLAVIKEANLLVSLSDGSISLHDLQDYGLLENLARTKGATTFSVGSDIVKDPSTGIPSIVSRLAVAVKRRLLLWSWHDTERSDDVVEIGLASPAKTLTWSNASKVICGLAAGYVIVDVESKEIGDISGPGSIGTGAASAEPGRLAGVGAASMGYMGMSNWGPKPLATRLTDGELLLAKDVNTLFVDGQGKALERRQIPWTTVPDAISFSYPFLLALQPTSKSTLEVRNPETQSLLQSIALPNASQIHVPQANVSLAHAGKGFLVASERCVWRMAAQDYGSQVDQLVAAEAYDEAISLLAMLEDALLDDKAGRLRAVRLRKAGSLFEAARYRDSLDLFTDACAAPASVIRLYPASIAGALAADVSEANDARRDDVDGTVKKIVSDAASIMSGRKTDVADASDSASVSSKRRATDGAGKRLEGDDLHEAVSALCSFLADARRRLQRVLTPDGTLKANALEQRADLLNLVDAVEPVADEAWEATLLAVARLVDTSLFKAYMLARPGLAGSLFRIANFCDPDVVNQKLLETGRYAELVDFFFGKKLHRPALELLQRFGEAKAEAEAEAADEAPPALKGPRRTIAYLQSLRPGMIELILEFARWPLRQDPDAGMEIFVADTENAETLPRQRVLDFLYDIERGLAVRYLEHVIHELNDLTPAFHQRLVQLYLERLDWRAAGHDRAWSDFDSETARADWQEKTLAFLRRSDQYSTAKALNLIPRDDPEFYEARAVVLSKMGQHKQALEIYVFKLQDADKAEEYCNQVHRAREAEAGKPSTERRGRSETSAAFDNDAPPSIYQTLLALYLRPPPPYEADWEPALRLLAKHGSRLPASSTLDLIPGGLPIRDLESYFRGRIRAANSLVNEGRVVSGLRKVERVRAQATVLVGDGVPGGNGGRNRRVVITDERVCGVCHRRLGGSAISVMPDNTVIHYGCANRGRPAPTSIAGLRTVPAGG